MEGGLERGMSKGKEREREIETEIEKDRARALSLCRNRHYVHISENLGTWYKMRA
jgi:hypothetical protein